MARTWLLLFLALRGQTLPTGKSLLPPSLADAGPIPWDQLSLYSDDRIHSHLVLRLLVLQMESTGPIVPLGSIPSLVV